VPTWKRLASIVTVVAVCVAPLPAAAQGTLTPEYLDQLLAPVALYPDQLLAQVLLSSGNARKVGELDAWLKKNAQLKGSELQQAAQAAGFEPSLVALALFPQVVGLMAGNLQWTSQIGGAFAVDRDAVFESIQRLRGKSKAVGNLKSTPQQKVETRTTDEGQQVIVIEPANPQVIYVPQYNPTVVYPPPVYPYPPMYYPPYYPGAALVSFGVGMAWGAAISGGWGCGWGGGNNDITINNNNNYVKNSNNRSGNQGNRSGNSSWQHNSAQRGGAPYKDKATASKYGGSARGDSASSRSAGAQSRQQQSRSGGDRASASSRSGGSGGFDRSSGGSSSRGGGSSQFSGGGGGGDRVGSRSSSSGSRGGSSAFGGGSGSSARSSSSRGSSSMSRSGGGRSGGGGRRR
jgi:uncharacterized protein DUF3300